MASQPNPCSCCVDKSRRTFIKASTAAIAAAALPRAVHAESSSAQSPETLVGEFYQSLTDQQRKVICMPYNNELMHRVNANWHVTKPVIGDNFYSDAQRTLIEQIVKNVTSEAGHQRLQEQMDYDDGGLYAYSLAMFGLPATQSDGTNAKSDGTSGPCQWLLTGRHLTLRADGNTADGIAFGGPLVYGHGDETSPESNLFYYQTKQVNQLYAALDPDQRKAALAVKPPAENDVKLRGAHAQFTGIQVNQLQSDQQQLVREVLATLLAPYREQDAKEAMSIIDAGGGTDALRFTFYQADDLQHDGIWDIWRIEGPNAVVHFRGAPHVHAYIHIGKPS